MKVNHYTFVDLSIALTLLGNIIWISSVNLNDINGVSVNSLYTL